VINSIKLESLPESLGIDEHDPIIKAVLLHELGHLLGLEDISDPKGVMHNSISTTRFFSNITRELPQGYSKNSLDKMKDICMGLSNSIVSKNKNGSTFDLVVNAKFNPYYEDERTVKIEFWSKDSEIKTMTMIKKGDMYRVNMGPISQDGIIHYRIVTSKEGSTTLYSDQRTTDLDNI